MKKYLLIFLLLLVSLVAYTYNGFSLLLGILLAFVLLFLVIIILLRFARKINPKWYQVPIMLIGICLLGILTSFFKPEPLAIIDSGDVSDQLKYAYQTDQTDRMNLKIYLGFSRKELRERDKLRLEQVERLYALQKITDPMDKFHAAFIYHHSSGSNNYEKANKLASEAAKELEGHFLSEWLAKATYDRWMLSLGKPEKYNTQESFTVERQLNQE